MLTLATCPVRMLNRIPNLPQQPGRSRCALRTRRGQPNDRPGFTDNLHDNIDVGRPRVRFRDHHQAAHKHHTAADTRPPGSRSHFHRRLPFNRHCTNLSKIRSDCPRLTLASPAATNRSGTNGVALAAPTAASLLAADDCAPTLPCRPPSNNSAATTTPKTAATDPSKIIGFLNRARFFVSF